MPANIREIKGRIKAVKNIERITRTMQLIASARFQKVQKQATQAHAYADRIAQMVGEVASSLARAGGADDAEGDNAPETSGGGQALLQPPAKPAGKTLVLIISSDRGLCGSYNTSLLRTAERFFGAQLPAEQRRLEVVGKKGINYCKFNGLAVTQAHTQFGDNPKFADIAALADRYMAEFASGDYDAVKVVYTKFISMSVQRPEVMTLLPLEPPTADKDVEAALPGTVDGPAKQADFEFSPDPAVLLAELLPATVKVTLQRAFNDALVSEQLSRMVAMKAATDAAGKQGKSLKRQFNRARQTSITTELSEIISGAAALE